MWMIRSDVSFTDRCASVTYIFHMFYLDAPSIFWAMSP